MANVEDLLQLRRYAKLRDYFEGMSREHFKHFTRDELFDCVGTKDHLRLKLFLMEPLFKGMAVHKESWMSQFLDLSDCVEGSTLDLGGKLYSTRYSGLVSGGTRQNITHVDRLLDFLCPETLQAIETLDLSDCNLFQEDVGIIRGLCARLPRCKTVNLSTNRILFEEHGGRGAQYADDLLEILKTKRVVVVDCPVASCLGKEFLEKLDATQHPNLIWVPERLLGGVEWTEFMEEVSTAIPPDQIVDHHRRYYAGIRE